MDKRKVLISSVIIATVLLIAGIVFAAVTASTTSKNYAIDVIDDGNTSKASDENLALQTKVVDVNEKWTEMTLETNIESLVDVKKNKEVAILVDTSYSMNTNTKLANVREKTLSLTNKILDEVNLAVMECYKDMDLNKSPAV